MERLLVNRVAGSYTVVTVRPSGDVAVFRDWSTLFTSVVALPLTVTVSVIKFEDCIEFVS